MPERSRLFGLAALVLMAAPASAKDQLNATVSSLGNTYPGGERWVPQGNHTKAHRAISRASQWALTWPAITFSFPAGATIPSW